MEEIKAVFKTYEVETKEYRFDKYKRTLLNEPRWEHYRYYINERAAQNATRDIRKSMYCRFDYPAMGNEENEKLYPHIKPTITIRRYRIVKRKVK